MTYRTPYMFAGYRADFNDEFRAAIEARAAAELMAEEMQRLASEAEAAIDHTEEPALFDE
jgi:hypothetical protein